MVICENVTEPCMAFVLECIFNNNTLQEFPKSKNHKELRPERPVPTLRFELGTSSMQA
jgi:hypothetical protein